MTNENGVATFKQIPYDVYILEVKETNNYKGFKQVINVFEKAQDDQPIMENY